MVSANCSTARDLTLPFSSSSSGPPLPHGFPLAWLIHGRAALKASTNTISVDQSRTGPRFKPRGGRTEVPETLEDALSAEAEDARSLELEGLGWGGAQV